MKDCFFFVFVAKERWKEFLFFDKMASGYRRASQDAGSRVSINSKTHRTGSIDTGLSPVSIDTSASQVQATVIAQGPAVAFFGSCVINDVFYIHGGVKTRADRSPSNRMYKFENQTWTDITTDDSPVLSYHRCVVWNRGQYILAIGGWDGSKRKSDVYVYDVANGSWHEADSSGFPSDGGLNNHAVVPLKSKDFEILVIGRDGSLRIQRRHGDAYCLRGDPNKRVFR